MLQRLQYHVLWSQISLINDGKRFVWNMDYGKNWFPKFNSFIYLRLDWFLIRNWFVCFQHWPKCEYTLISRSQFMKYLSGWYFLSLSKVTPGRSVTYFTFPAFAYHLGIINLKIYLTSVRIDTIFLSVPYIVTRSWHFR